MSCRIGFKSIPKTAIISKQMPPEASYLTQVLPGTVTQVLLGAVTLNGKVPLPSLTVPKLNHNNNAMPLPTVVILALVRLRQEDHASLRHTVSSRIARAESETLTQTIEQTKKESHILKQVISQPSTFVNMAEVHDCRMWGLLAMPLGPDSMLVECHLTL